MGGASSIAENTEMERRDHISSERQDLISGVNMESSAEKSVREAGGKERVASDQGREKVIIHREERAIFSTTQYQRFVHFSKQ